MSAGIDVNVLLYASDSTSELFPRARGFLEQRAASSELLFVWWGTLMSYLRIATHPSIFARPLGAAEAEANVQSLIGLPQTRVLHEEDGFWDIYREVTRSAPSRGNMVPDAHLASVLRQHGVKVLYTNDVDFRRFAFLETRNPFS
jgi:toxin-antitoxin system PIN domain toxin